MSPSRKLSTGTGQVQGGQAQLLKLHGDLNHPDELIATEEDFDTFVGRYPLKATFAANLLITRTPVLLGYSFDDPDTRSLWALIRDRLGLLQRKGYVVLLGASSTEVARFARRNITVVNLPTGNYSETFTQLFDELRAKFNEEVGSISRPAEDEVAAELVLPVDAPSRLCFCSVPVKLLPWYRNEVFPIIEAAGYVTVTREDVLSEGANAAATINALLSRSSLALIDGSSFSTGHELGMALDVLSPERVIVILEKSRTPAVSLRSSLMLANVPVIVRDEDPIESADDLIIQIQARLSVLTLETSQPRRLLTQGHPNAAVAVAFGLLEEALAVRAEAIRAERPPSLMRLIGWAAENDILNPEELSRFRQWVGLRNRAVHTSEPISADAARRALDDIEALLARLQQVDEPPSTSA